MITAYYDVMMDEYFYQYKDSYYFDTLKDSWLPGHVKLETSMIKSHMLKWIDLELSTSYLKMYNDIPSQDILRSFILLIFKSKIKK